MFSTILFKYSIKALKSLKCFKRVLSLLLIKNWYFASYGFLANKWILPISGWWFIKLNNELVFPDSEPPIINILWTIRNLWPIWFMFFYVFFCNIIKINDFLHRFTILLRLIFSFFHRSSLFIPCAYVSTESIDYVLLSSFELNSILLISSVKTLCISLLNLCCFNTILFFMSFCYFL